MDEPIKVSDDQPTDVELVKSGSALSEHTTKEAEDNEDIFEEEGEGQLTIDVFQEGNNIIVESPIAGVDPDNLDIDITNESVTIRGKRMRQHRVKEEDYFYQECYWGRFSRSVILPQEIDAENSEASIKNGVLTITLPKINRQKKKKIKVKVF